MHFINKLKIFGFSVLIIAAIILLILPSDFFDEGQSICLSVLIANKECYACGMTRGIQHLIHFEFAEAYKFNKLSFIAFPLIIIVMALELRTLVKDIKK